MKILVTGANGYLGRGVVKQLLDDGFDVIATDFSKEFIDPRAHIIVGNIFEMENPFFELGKPDVVLHMAWRDGFVHNSEKHILDLPHHALFLQKMLDSGISRLAVMGTMHEIGFFEGCVDEDTPCKPQSLYGISKDALRRIVRANCDLRNVLFQWLRGFYIVSNSPNGSSIFAKIAQYNNLGKKTFPFTTGTNYYDFLDYSVFCNLVAKTVEQSHVLGIINICSGFPQKLADRVELFIKENKFDIKLEYGAFPDRPYDSKAIWGNNAKIKTIMGENDL